MTNPVVQNAAGLPNANAAFFNADGRTVSPQWRAFFRTLATVTGSSAGGNNLSALTTQVQQIASEVGALELESTELQMLVQTDAAAALFGALVSRIGALEAAVMAAPVPVPARHVDALPEPVFPARRESDDLRKLVEQI